MDESLSRSKNGAVNVGTEVHPGQVYLGHLELHTSKKSHGNHSFGAQHDFVWNSPRINVDGSSRK
jgi:hypothetical protein